MLSNSLKEPSEKKPPSSSEKDIRKMRKSNYLKETAKLSEIEKSFWKDITYTTYVIKKTNCNYKIISKLQTTFFA